MLQQLLATGVIAQAPAVPQPIPVETDAPVDLQSSTMEPEGAAPGASAGTPVSVKTGEQPPVFPRTGLFSLLLPSVSPLEVLQTTTDGVKEGAPVDAPESTASVARMVEPERKVAMTQPAVAAAILDLLDEAEPVRMADVPVVTREENEKARPLPETPSRDMTRTAVAEGVREYERQKTGDTNRDGARTVTAAPGVVRDEPKPKPKPVITAATPVADEAPTVVRSAGQSAAPVVEPSMEIMPEELRAAVVIEVRQSGATPAQGVPAKREPQEATQESVPPEVKEKEAVQTKAVVPAGAVVTEGEPRDNQAGRAPFPHEHTGTAAVRADGVRVTEGGARMAELFQTLPPDTARTVVDQVVKGLALKVQGENSEVRIRLEPPSLGEVVVSMRMENGKLQAQIDVTQAAVKGALDGNLGQLRQSLSTRGIEVQRLDVVFSGGPGARGSEGGQGDRQRRHGGRQLLGAEAVEQYQTGRLLGYNTMEMVM
jgi:flagellar hook-length control protein FliK